MPVPAPVTNAWIPVSVIVPAKTPRLVKLEGRPLLGVRKRSVSEQVFPSEVRLQLPDGPEGQGPPARLSGALHVFPPVVDEEDLACRDARQLGRGSEGGGGGFGHPQLVGQDPRLEIREPAGLFEEEGVDRIRVREEPGRETSLPEGLGEVQHRPVRPGHAQQGAGPELVEILGEGNAELLRQPLPHLPKRDLSRLKELPKGEDGGRYLGEG